MSRCQDIGFGGERKGGGHDVPKLLCLSIRAKASVVLIQDDKVKHKVPAPTLSKKLAKLINSKVASDPRIGHDADQYWECAEIAQLVEQRIRNA